MLRSNNRSYPGLDSGTEGSTPRRCKLLVKGSGFVIPRRSQNFVTVISPPVLKIANALIIGSMSAIAFHEKAGRNQAGLFWSWS